MSKTHRIRVIYSSGSSQVGDKTYDYITDIEKNLQVEIPINGSTTITYVQPFATLKSLFMESTRAITVATNDIAAGSPDDTVVLAADVPFVWSADVGGTNPFANGDVLTLHVTLPNSGVAAVLTLYSTSDATP